MRFSHRFPQSIWQPTASTRLLRVIEAAEALLSLVAVACAGVDTAISGCSVREWMPYACRHSLMVRALSMKVETFWSDTTMWADAIAFFWSNRQICSSWTDSMPGI